MSFKEALVFAKELDVYLIPYELAKGMKETKELIRSIEPGRRRVLLGPEGGFEEEEVADAMEAVPADHSGTPDPPNRNCRTCSSLMFQLEMKSQLEDE